MTDPTYNQTAAGRGDRFVISDRLQHVSWGAIFAGLVIAIAVQFLLGLLGLGLGLTILDPSDPMGGISGWGIATGIYIVVVQIVSLFVGGYVAARLAPAHTDQTSMFHGLSIWALATIIMVWLGGNTVGLAVSGLTSAVSAVGSGTAQAVEAVIPEDISMPDISYQALPEEIKQKLRQSGITPENFQQELRSAFNQVVSRQERQQLVQRLRQTIAGILQNPTRAPEEIEQAIDDVFSQGGILSEEDLTQLKNTLQRQLNLTEQETQKIINQIEQAIDEARTAVKEGVETARQQAVDAAEAASDAIASIALWLFVANLLALIAAVAGGRAGEVKDTV
jgi:DNA-binding NarL/FixJ family response regulator